MSESELNTYRLQMQQVEAALTADPDNQELIKLKGDLDNVINLTQELINEQLNQGNNSGAGAAISSSSSSSKDQDDESFSAAEGSSGRGGSNAASTYGESSSSSSSSSLMPVKHWQVGENCQALWYKDNQYHEAVIQEITTDGEVSVKFKQFGTTGCTSLGLLRLSASGVTGIASQSNKKAKMAAQKEYLKKKKQKKLERLQQMEQEREVEKNKWKSFSSKAFGKKGFVKKSIFKTPENQSGRVGIGTCGVAGQQMTKYNGANQYRKGQ